MIIDRRHFIILFVFGLKNAGIKQLNRFTKQFMLWVFIGDKNYIIYCSIKVKITKQRRCSISFSNIWTFENLRARQKGQIR